MIMKKNILALLVVVAGGLFIAAYSYEDFKVEDPSVQTFTPLTALDSVTSPKYLTWENNSLRKGTGYWLINIAKAVTDSAKTQYIIVQQSAQTAPLRGVTQRWYDTDTIVTLSGKVATPIRTYNGCFSHPIEGREVRLKIVSTDDITISKGDIDFTFKPDNG
jgi:hypothetical protein